jgi:flagellar biosynthesis protein FlhA
MCLALVPSLPKFPFLIVGGGLLFIARRLTPEVESVDLSHGNNRADDNVEVPENADSPESLIEEMRVDPIELEVSIDVVDLVDVRAGGDLLTRVKALRRKIALELGFVMPAIRTRDDFELPASTYRIRIHGVEVGRGMAPPGMVMAIGDLLQGLPGEVTREPVFGLEAKWIAEDLQHQAEMTGATVVDRASVITTHLAEVVRQNASILLSREDVRTLVEALRKTNPTSVEELTPAIVTLGEIQRVLQLLLLERVPIRDLVRIFEAMSTKGRGARPEAMAEAARGALGSAICASLAPDGILDLLTLDPILEQDLLTSLHADESGVVLVVDPTVANAMVRQLHREISRLEAEGRSPALVVSAPLRAPMRNLMSAELPDLAVVAYTELVGQIEIRTRGVVSLAHASAA